MTETRLSAVKAGTGNHPTFYYYRLADTRLFEGFESCETLT